MTFRSGRVALLLLAWAWLSSLAAAQSVWEFTPYQIQAYVTLGSDPRLTPELAEEVARHLVTRTDTLIGPAWFLQAAPTPPELRTLALQLLEPTLPLTPDAWLHKLDLDKLVFITITADEASAYAIWAREFDQRLRLWSTPRRFQVPQRERLPAAAFQALLEVFCPLAQVELRSEKEAVLLLRAGALPPRDRGLQLVRNGDIFQPALRFNDRDGLPRKITPIEWTLLTVSSVSEDGTDVTAAVHTGLRSPLSNRRRGRVEQLALLVRPPLAPTQLLLRSRTQTHQPLAGYEIFAYGTDSKATDLLGQTNRDGAIVIPPHPGVRIVIVKHGGELLAKLPLVPGIQPRLAAYISDDTERLEAEGIVVGFQQAFIDLIARRKLYISRARKAVDDGKFDEARQHLEELKKLGSYAELTQTLRMAKQKVVSTDPRTQAKINKLFSDTQKVVDKFFNDAEIEELTLEINRAASQPAPTGGG
jgi:hypothetical protein